jgi:hypothetical protein
MLKIQFYWETESFASTNREKKKEHFSEFFDRIAKK